MPCSVPIPWSHLPSSDVWCSTSVAVTTCCFPVSSLGRSCDLLTRRRHMQRCTLANCSVCRGILARLPKDGHMPQGAVASAVAIRSPHLS